MSLYLNTHSFLSNTYLLIKSIRNQSLSFAKLSYLKLLNLTKILSHYRPSCPIFLILLCFSFWLFNLNHALRPDLIVFIYILFCSLSSSSLISFYVIEFFCIISAIRLNIRENFSFSYSIENNIPIALFIFKIESTLSFLCDFIMSSIAFSLSLAITSKSIFFTL